MKHTVSKLLVPFLALALVASACGGGSGKVDVFKDIREAEAKDVDAPERIDPKVLANPGLTLSTNSSTWRKLLDAPEGRGAVVLFVQPGAAADRRGIRRGDLITEIDGERVTNSERAQALLWSNRGETRKLKFLVRNDREREIELKGEVLRQNPVQYVNVLIDSNPNDPVLRYIRSGLGGSTVPQDLTTALKEEPNFTEALTRQGTLLFAQSRVEKDKNKQQATLAKALASFANALDISPRHGETLAQQSIALSSLGRGAQAKADADKAVKTDGSLAIANSALARAQLALKKPAEAAGPARAAIELVPIGNLGYYRLLADIFADLRRKEDCERTLLATVPWLEGTKRFRKEADLITKESKENCG